MNFKHDDIEHEIRSTRRLSLGFIAIALLLKLAIVGTLNWGGAVLILHFIN